MQYWFYYLTKLFDRQGDLKVLQEDFNWLAELYEIRPERARRFIGVYGTSYDKVEQLIKNSFMTAAGKDDYLCRFNDRLQLVIQEALIKSL